MQKISYVLKIFKGCLVLTVLLLCGCAGSNDLQITTAPPSQETVGEAEAAAVSEAETEDEAYSGAGSGDAPVSESPYGEAETTIYVQVTGAVRFPGVYELPPGSRVFEAVQKAGGMTDHAAPESLNQALEVTDGQMIVLYTTAEWEAMQEDGGALGGENGNVGGAAAESVQDDGRVNINTASLEELCTISGIGQSRAQSIITYREQNGAFGSIEEIMNVTGIKDGLFQKIKDKIKV